MDPQQATPRPAGRPRDPGLDIAIRTAAIELIGEGGIEACALDEVARRAGVGKATIYRRWASKDALVVDAFRYSPPMEVPSADQGSLAADARALLAGLVASLETPLALATRQLMPMLASHPEIAEVYRTRFAGAWTQAMDDVLARAEARGEVAPGAFPVLALRAASALVTQRWLMHVGTPDEALVDQLVEALVVPHLATA